MSSTSPLASGSSLPLASPSPLAKRVDDPEGAGRVSPPGELALPEMPFMSPPRNWFVNWSIKASLNFLSSLLGHLAIWRVVVLDERELVQFASPLQLTPYIVLSKRVHPRAPGLLVESELELGGGRLGFGIETSKAYAVGRLADIDQTSPRFLARHLGVGRLEAVGVAAPHAEITYARALPDEQLVRGNRAKPLDREPVAEHAGVADRLRP